MTLLGFLWLLLKKAIAWIQESSPGLLGLAISLGLAALIRARNNRNRNRPSSEGQPDRESGRMAGQLGSSRAQPQDERGVSVADAVTGTGGGVRHRGHAGEGGLGRDPRTKASTGGEGVRGGVQAKLQGSRRVTLSLPGVVFEERELQDSATVLGAETVRLVQQLLQAADVYMIAHVADDIGQAVVTGALEAAGLLGPLPTQLPPQRLLFCSTQPGKQSIVRQIESELHIDGDAVTVEDLKRFVPQLLWVGNTGAPAGSECVASLVEFFSESS